MENFIFLCSVIFTLLYSGRNLFAEFIVRFQSICFPEQFLAATSDARNFCIISKYTTISNRRIMRPMFRKYLSKQLVLANFPFYLLLSGISKKEHKKVTKFALNSPFKKHISNFCGHFENIDFLHHLSLRYCYFLTTTSHSKL